ncbi:hypothetical protein GCM10027359_28790 [Marilutibacter aestuarii]
MHMPLPHARHHESGIARRRSLHRRQMWQRMRWLVSWLAFATYAALAGAVQ